MPVRFPASLYARYRPYYSADLFALLRAWMLAEGIRLPARIADVGCGVGHSTAGLVQSGIAREVRAVEPDSEMLGFARKEKSLQSGPVVFVNQPGEKTGLPDRSVDAVFCASAFHWMDRPRAAAEFARIVRRPGLIFLCEYRFPRSSAHPGFNEWIKEMFEGEWQIPELRDRGSFANVISPFDEMEGVRSLGIHDVPMIQTLGWRELAGLIRTQSRYVRKWEALPSEQARAAFDRETEAKVHSLLGDEQDRYDFRLLAAGFALD